MIVGIVLFVIAFFLEQYKVPVTFMGTTVGYDRPYAGISTIVLPVSIVLGAIGCIAGFAYYATYSIAPLAQGKTFCTHCGKEIRSDAVYCPECGYSSYVLDGVPRS